MGLLRIIALFAALAVAACDGGRFDDDVVLRGQGAVHGGVYAVDGGARRPVGGATVFLIDQAGARRLTTTEADGRFQLGDVPAGQARVIVNDAGRRGSLRDVNVYASGDNDLGEVYVQPLEQVAALVDIPDIGFEERVTRVAANAEAPVPRPDGTSVFLHRRVTDAGGWLHYELREAKLPAGDEIVLWPGNMTPGPGEFLGGRFLTFAGCVWDTAAGTGRCSQPFSWNPLRRYAWNGAVYGIDEKWDYSDHYSYLAHLVSYFGGGWTHLGPYDDYLVPVAAFSEGALTLMFNGNTDGMATLAHWDLASGTASEPIRVPHTTYPGYQVVGEGHDRAYYLANDHLGVVDFATGSSRVLYFNTMYDIRPAGPSRLIVSGYLRYPGTGLWLMRTDHPVDESTFYAAFTMLPREPHMSIDGREVTLCEDPNSGNCSAEYLSNGVIRIATRRDQEHYVVDIDLDGNVLRKRVLDLEDSGSAIIERADGGQEVIARRDSPTGFTQLWVAELDGGLEPQYRQVTFLPADHSSPFYSSDGDWLYSFVRDPLSGYVQLFRVRVRRRE